MLPEVRWGLHSLGLLAGRPVLHFPGLPEFLELQTVQRSLELPALQLAQRFPEVLKVLLALCFLEFPAFPEVLEVPLALCFLEFPVFPEVLVVLLGQRSLEALEDLLALYFLELPVFPEVLEVPLAQRCLELPELQSALHFLECPGPLLVLHSLEFPEFLEPH